MREELYNKVLCGKRIDFKVPWDIFLLLQSSRSLEKGFHLKNFDLSDCSHYNGYGGRLIRFHMITLIAEHFIRRSQ